MRQRREEVDQTVSFLQRWDPTQMIGALLFVCDRNVFGWVERRAATEGTRTAWHFKQRSRPSGPATCLQPCKKVSFPTPPKSGTRKAQIQVEGQLAMDVQDASATQGTVAKDSGQVESETAVLV